MKNAWEDRGDHVAIIIEHKEVILETLVDWSDFILINSLPYKWYGREDTNRPGKFYAFATNVPKKNEKGKTTLYMHRLIAGETNKQVDHEDNNGLNNRRSNLRPATRSQNQQNQKKVNSSNTSGITGVVWNKQLKKWQVQLKKNQNPYYFGRYESKAEATLVAMYARAIIFPYSEEAKIYRRTLSRTLEIEEKLMEFKFDGEEIA